MICFYLLLFFNHYNFTSKACKILEKIRVLDCDLNLLLCSVESIKIKQNQIEDESEKQILLNEIESLESKINETKEKIKGYLQKLSNYYDKFSRIY